MLVEDDPGVRWLIARMLRAEGLNVLEAGNGLEALELCEHHDVAVVVTDVVMPRMGGIELGRRIAGNWPRTEVLYVTAYPAAEVDVPPARTVTKPFDPDDFVALVRSLADRYRGQGGPGECA